MIRKSTDGVILVVGGGLSGLVTALLLGRSTRTPIFLIEKSKEVGGLLRSFDGGEFGFFDHGMHTFTSSGIPELDNTLYDLLPENEWIIMRGKTRDLSGVFFEGRLQTACHYPDLRSLGKEYFRDCVADLCGALENEVSSKENLEGYFSNRFGLATTERVFSPIINKLYGLSPAKMDPIVAKMFPFDRVALFEEGSFLDLMKSDRIRSRIAYPDQRNLDLQYASTRYSLYPKNFGSFRLPFALKEKIQELGITLLLNTEVQSVESDTTEITKITVQRAGELLTFETPKQVFWTTGLSSFFSSKSPFESHRTPAVMNILLDHPLDVRDLYYFWCWDPKFQTYRVTYYPNYCPTAHRAGGYPVGFEFALHTDTDEKSLADLATPELKEMGLFPKGAKVLFSIGGKLPVGFPTFSLKNRQALETLRVELNQRKIQNLSITGIQSEWGVIYQPEVLAHTYHSVNRFLATLC